MTPQVCQNKLFYSAESLQERLPFGEQSLFRFGGVRVPWGPEGTAGPHGGGAGARGVWTQRGRGCSSGRPRFFRWNLMGDPQGTVEGVKKPAVSHTSVTSSFLLFKSFLSQRGRHSSEVSGIQINTLPPHPLQQKHFFFLLQSSCYG